VRRVGDHDHHSGTLRFGLVVTDMGVAALLRELCEQFREAQACSRVKVEHDAVAAFRLVGKKFDTVAAATRIFEGDAQGAILKDVVFESVLHDG
jgi:hypothetical protein